MRHHLPFPFSAAANDSGSQKDGEAHGRQVPQRRSSAEDEAVAVTMSPNRHVPLFF